VAESDAFSIKLFLVDGTPDGLRIVEKSNWTGVGLVCTRSQYPNVRDRMEFQAAAAYVLVGPGEPLLPRVYIGEAEVLRKRLDSHQKNNEFWTRFIAFTSRDGNLNKAHVRYLEARLIGLAKAAKRAEVTNNTAPPNPSLSEAETADVESFLRDMLLIFPLLEVNAFQVSGKQTTVTSYASPTSVQGVVDVSLQLSGPSASGTGADTPEGFIVKAGSKARAATVRSIHKWLVDLRETLLAQGILAPQGDHLIFTQDYAFDSPSSAAGVLLGRAANGRTEWKTAEGQTLKELQTASVGGHSA
jgi:Domain of unknown function (DUF4357)